MTAPQSILELVDRFAYNRDNYRNPQYNETQLRREFLDPFFTALGWDVENKEGYAEAYKDVVHEDAIKIGGVNKAPDYSFRIGGTRKFFVEAKKPAVNLKDDPKPAFQLRRYAWSAKLPLSILSDFEEFAVYDCRVQPDERDKPAIARTLYIPYTEYDARWQEIEAVFSRSAILKGAFDKYATDNKTRRGTAEVDAAFLKEIETWRESLAKNIALRNPDLRNRDLNFAVQIIIDRIIFLRICEDRGIDIYGRLQALLNGKDVYPRLLQLFREADERYNSGLFHFRMEKGRDEAGLDTLTPRLNIDDKTLKDILTTLYYPCPYEFSVLPADILGQVYEQFLGKVIRLDAKHRAVVEDKPEVKKAGGVYYTPTYIVNYIVEQTVGKLLEGKTPRQVEKLKILDPACGSGSFLIGAYQRLLDWHQQWYETDGAAKHARGKDARLYQGAGNTWHLTTSERKRILLANLYGVDIDAQAVEVTKLSLLLKMLEGETQQTVNATLSMFHERVLPDLDGNIQCGNSLIGPDFYDGRQLTLLDEEEMYRVNVFDWKTAFPAILTGDNPGFDAVIGNPPYIRIQAMKEFAPLEVEHYKTRYASAKSGNYDIYVVFIEKGASLLNTGGRLGYILPSKFFSTDYGMITRDLLSSSNAVEDIVDFGHAQVFSSATTYTCLLFLRRGRQTTDTVSYIRTLPADLRTQDTQATNIPANTLGSSSWIFAGTEGEELRTKIGRRGVPLLELPAAMSRGTSTGADTVFCLHNQNGVLTTRSGEVVDIEEELLRAPLYASDFNRYIFRPQQKERLIFPYVVTKSGYSLIAEDDLRSKYPKAFDYLTRQRKILQERKDFQQWYGYSAPRNLHTHEGADILVPLLADRGLFAPFRVEGNNYCLMASGGFSITLLPDAQVHSSYILGLLNSRLLFWNLRLISNKFRGGWITCTKQYVGTLPIRAIDFNNIDDKARHERMVSLVEQMLHLHKQAAEAAPTTRTVLQRQIELTDRQIDALVYELYALTPDEIALVEGRAEPEKTHATNRSPAG